ncbi:unnamed protein product [Rhizopus stolonifer]
MCNRVRRTQVNYLKIEFQFPQFGLNFKVSTMKKISFSFSLSLFGKDSFIQAYHVCIYPYFDKRNEISRSLFPEPEKEKENSAKTFVIKKKKNFFPFPLNTFFFFFV